MDTLLIVAGTAPAAASLTALLVPGFFSGATAAHSAAAARRLANEREFALVLISSPLPDEPGRRLAADLAAGLAAGVLLLEPPGFAGEAGAPHGGVITLEKPLNRALFEKTVQIMHTCGLRAAALMEENKKLAARLEEARLVGRAKCALIAYRHITEAEAHHCIEKQAMDTRLPKREVARDILRIFEG